MVAYSLHLRGAAPGDAAGCAYVHHTSWVEAYSELLPASHWATDTLERRTKRWDQWLKEGLEVTVAELGGRIVGIAATGQAQAVGDHHPVRELDLWMLYVLAAHHGSGVGQTLLDALVPADEQAQLWVAKNNPRAHRFYERNGFIPDGAQYVGEELPLPAIRMVR